MNNATIVPAIETVIANDRLGFLLALAQGAGLVLLAGLAIIGALALREALRSR